MRSLMACRTASNFKGVRGCSVLPKNQFSENQCLVIDLMFLSIVLYPDEKLGLYILYQGMVGLASDRSAAQTVICFNLQYNSCVFRTSRLEKTKMLLMGKKPIQIHNPNQPKYIFHIGRIPYKKKKNLFFSRPFSEFFRSWLLHVLFTGNWKGKTTLSRMEVEFMSRSSGFMGPDRFMVDLLPSNCPRCYWRSWYPTEHIFFQFNRNMVPKWFSEVSETTITATFNLAEALVCRGFLQKDPGAESGTAEI